MKKYLTFLLCLLFALAPCGAVENSNLEETYTSQETLKKIDKETQKCIDTHFETDYTMMLCVVEGTKKYSAEIEKTMKAAQNILPKPKYERLAKEQHTWEKSLSRFNYINNMEYLPFQPRLLAENDRYHYIKSRAIYLCKFMNNFSK